MMQQLVKRKRASNTSRSANETSSTPGGNRPQKKIRSTDSSDVLKVGGGPGSEGSIPPSERPGLVCVSITCVGGKLGGSYLHPETFVLHLLEDTIDSNHFDTTRMFLEQARPDIVIAPSRADERFLSMCRDFMEECDGTFQVRPHREFVPEKGRDKMLSLSLFSHMPPDDDNHSAENSASSNAYDFMRKRHANHVDLTAQRRVARIRSANYASDIAPLCFSSVGALLDYLCRNKAAGDLDDEGISSLDVRSIELLAMDGVMQINADALSSLQIFEAEGHASVHSTRSKEGLSLFGILDFTKTSLGKSLLREWCFRPSLSIPIISARHDAVECFIRTENLSVSDTIHTHLKGLKNAPRCIGIIKAGKANMSDWQAVVKAVYHFSIIMEVIGDLSYSKTVAILQKLHVSVDVMKLREMGEMINETIDWETSENERRVCVRQHIDPELDEFKRVYNGLDSLLSKVALQVRKSVPYEWASSLNVLYFPQLGYLMCVPLGEEWRHRSDFEVIEGWKHQFSSEDSAYFKSREMLDLDECIGDLHTRIADRYEYFKRVQHSHSKHLRSEIEIIHQLQDNALVYERDLLLTCELCAELDCLLSFATACRLYDYTRPEMVEDNIIDIKKGRHPLVEQLSDLFVPNDLYLVGGCGIHAKPGAPSYKNSDDIESDGTPLPLQHPGPYSVLVCTGANACGKSVYLKQNALIPFMAQIGCFVPAESARLGVIDKIFTRLQTKESVSKIQSAFMIELNQVSLALRNATARSLLLLDEFGKGTLSTGQIRSPIDSRLQALQHGAGLFCGVIQHLLRFPNDGFHSTGTPKVLAATHYHEVFTTGLLDVSLPIRFVHMEAMLTSEGSEIIQGFGSASTQGQAFDDGGNKVNIHYLYRVAEGLSMASSHATKCALLYGIPRRVVARAEYVSRLISRHQIDILLDEEMTETEKMDLEDAEAVCRRFLEWDLEEENEEDEDVKKRLRDVLGRRVSGDKEVSNTGSVAGL